MMGTETKREDAEMFRIIKSELNRFFKFDLIGGIFTGEFFKDLPAGEDDEDDETLFFFKKEPQPDRKHLSRRSCR